MPPVKAFRDDTTILSSKESTTHKILNLIDKQMIWYRMKFKPKKSRNLLLSKVGGQRIPTVSEEPVKVWNVGLMRPCKILIKRKKHREHKKVSIRLIDVVYKKNSRFSACSIYLFRCYYGCYLYTKLRQVRLSQWRLT